MSTNLFLVTAPIGFVHVFQLWTFPEPWALKLFSFVIGPRFECALKRVSFIKLSIHSLSFHTISFFIQYRFSVIAVSFFGRSF